MESTGKQTYTPAQAAPLVGVHGNSIRAWCNEYAEVLSPGASARPRKLTPGDVATLQHVAAYRAAGLSPTDILQRLREMPPDALQQPTVNAAPESPPPAPLAPPDALSAAVAALAASIAAERSAPGATVEDVRREQDATRAEVARLRSAVIVVGAVVGVLMLVVVILLLVRL
jgi:hypothetical protein